MKRLVLMAVAPLLLSPLWAQDTIVSTRVSAGACGAFFVDGQRYVGTATFLWPENSKHDIVLGQSYYIASDIRCDVASVWADQNGRGLGLSGSLVFIANRNITQVNAGSSISYLLRLDFFTGGPTSPGSVQVSVTVDVLCSSLLTPEQYVLALMDPNTDWSKMCSVTQTTGYTTNVSTWQLAGSQVDATAVPSSGFVFTGWGGDLASSSQAYSRTFKMDRPLVLQPMFEPAVRVQFLTVPDGLTLLADRSLIASGATLDWRAGSQHALSPVSPQSDSIGSVWVFDSWSQGGEENQVYTAPPTSNVPVTLTAKYVPGVRVSFSTVPQGLKLIIDGRSNWPNYNFVWKAGSQHKAVAPLEQVGAQGRKYAYRSWSVAGGNEQVVTVPADGSTAGFQADYEIEGQLTIQGPPGAWALVDGARCAMPCVVDRLSGTTVRVAAVTGDAGDFSRLDFQGWADGGPAERQWTAGKDAQTIVANFQAAYRVVTAAEPAEHGTVQIQPASADGFYAEGTDITLTAQPVKGYRLQTWEGDLTGNQTPITVKVSSSMVIKAIFEKAPEVTPVGVRNAAGETPDAVVAPGSIITIYGAKLAEAYEKGPDNPLAQTIGDVAVTVGSRILPLVFVSPEQINAQLPSDLPEGDYRLVVRPQEMAEVTATFTVRRNAPGLFAETIDTKQFALATHADGSKVCMDSPAAKGETITLSGTGFGPYIAGGGLLDGFAAPSAPVAKLEDPVEIVLPDRVVTPVSAQAAAGLVGVTAVTLKIGDDWPAASTIELKARVNGRLSNTVLLPLK
jgi:uncharacterized protein (TIGR03437 family)